MLCMCMLQLSLIAYKPVKPLPMNSCYSAKSESMLFVLYSNFKLVLSIFIVGIVESILVFFIKPLCNEFCIGKPNLLYFDTSCRYTRAFYGMQCIPQI